MSEWQKPELRKLVAMFQKVELRTIHQVMTSGGKKEKVGLGYTALERDDFKRPVPKTITKDVDSFFEIRADDGLRVFGFWEGSRAQLFRFHKGHKALKGQ